MFELNRLASTGWHQLKIIDRHFCYHNDFQTLSISNNQLKCCSRDDGLIKVYTLSGELLLSIGASIHGYGDAGYLAHPYISDDDDEGSVLIADTGNDKLKVMSEQGEFSVLQLQPPVSRPRSAVLFNNQLYVTSHNEKLIAKYSC